MSSSEELRFHFISMNEPQHVTIRETYDVDCIVEVVHRSGYEDFSRRLRVLGFSEDMKSKVLCRFTKNDLILDVMPTDPKILGFSNRWYSDGFKKSIEKNIDGEVVKVISLPYLIATKIEAFKGRGNGSYITSHDIEDIATILDGCSKSTFLINETKGILKTFLKENFSSLLTDKSFLSSIEAHISNRTNIQGRKKIILGRMKIVADN